MNYIAYQRTTYASISRVNDYISRVYHVSMTTYHVTHTRAVFQVAEI